MKNRKTMTILSLACTAFLITACGHKDSTKESTSSSVKVEKTTKTSKSSSMTKSSSKDKMATGKSSTETKASTSDKMDKTQTPASSSQTPASSQASTTQTNGSSQAEQANQNAQTTSEPGKGVAIVDTHTGGTGGIGVTSPTSGTLYLEQAVPAYTGTNKDLGAVYTIPAGSIFWDQYLVGDDGNYWYSYMGYDGNRYYIAYEDAKQ